MEEKKSPVSAKQQTNDWVRGGLEDTWEDRSGKPKVREPFPFLLTPFGRAESMQIVFTPQESLNVRQLAGLKALMSKMGPILGSGACLQLLRRPCAFVSPLQGGTLGSMCQNRTPQLVCVCVSFLFSQKDIFKKHTHHSTPLWLFLSKEAAGKPTVRPPQLPAPRPDRVVFWFFSSHARLCCADGIVPEAARVLSLMGAQVRRFFVHVCCRR